MNKRPNIIIFNPDQMRADTLHHLGNPAAITPFLDFFAETEAVSFRNAFCQNPVCVPSRCSFMSGLYPHVEGHRTMGHLLHTQETSLLKELKEAGYYVWSNARNDLVAEQLPGQIKSHVTELYYGGNAAPAPGPVIENIRGQRGDKNFYSFYNGELKLDEHNRNYSADDEDVDAAIQRILHPVDDRPLCLFLGTMYPHPPYQIEEPYFSAIDRELLPDRIRPEDTKGKALILELIRSYQNMQAYTEHDWKELRAVYLGMCMKIDRQFQQLCEALKEAGEYDNSAIFFFSDHGDYTGDYGLTEKTQNTFEDCLTNVPFLVKPPKGYELDPGIADGLIELVDFYPTALEFAKTSPSHDHFGKSLVPMIGNRIKQIRSFVCCEGGRRAEEIQCREGVDPALEGKKRNIIYWPRYAAQWNDEAHAKGTMIRSSRYKYVYRGNGASEFYDLEKDARETVNQAENPEYEGIIGIMSLELLSWYQNTCDIVPHTIDERFSPQMIWEKVKHLCPDGCEKDVRAKIEAGMGLFPAQSYCSQLQKQQEKNPINRTDYLICIDSDGCAIDSMNVKHIQCFGPAFIELWHMENRQKHLLKRWNEINLFSSTRGINRFKGLAIILQETPAAGPASEIQSFISWTEHAPELSNEALRVICSTPQTNIIFERALQWSLRVNELIEQLPVSSPFSPVHDCLELIKKKADIAVVSSANQEAICTEWENGSLLSYVNHIFSQSDGSKSQCIGKILQMGYLPDHVLMVGDAPGDYDAASQNRVWFYPILADAEEESWKQLTDVYLQKFFSGEFHGELQKKLLDGMKKNLGIV